MQRQRGLGFAKAERVRVCRSREEKRPVTRLKSQREETPGNPLNSKMALSPHVSAAAVDLDSKMVLSPHVSTVDVELDRKMVLSPHVSAADVELDSKMVLSPHVSAADVELDSKMVLSPHVSAADVELDSKMVLSPHVSAADVTLEVSNYTDDPGGCPYRHSRKNATLCTGERAGRAGWQGKRGDYHARIPANTTGKGVPWIWQGCRAGDGGLDWGQGWMQKVIDEAMDEAE